MTTSHRSTLNRWPLTCFMTGRDQVWNLDGSFKTIVEQQQQQGRSCMCFFCSLFFILSPWLFFVEVILAVRVIWIDVSTFECIFESICRAGHSIPSAPHQQSSRARIPGVPKIGVQNLLLHTAKVSYDGGNGLRFYSCACPSKRGKLLTRFTFHPFFKKEWMMALLTCYLLAQYPGLNLEKV